MIFIKKLIKKPFFWLILISFVYLSPNIVNPNFSYIDDGQSLLNAKNFIEGKNWQSILFESHLGRTRPFYQLYFVALYLLGGVNPFIFWFGQAIVLSLTLIGIWTFITSFENINKNLLKSGLLVFLIVPATIDNFYRLGTAEPRQVLGIIWFLVWLRKIRIDKLNIKDFLIGNILLMFSLGTKETTLLIFPMLGFFIFTHLFQKFRNKKRLILLFFTLFLQGLIFYLLMPKFKGYSSSMSFAPNRIWHSLLVTRLEFAEFYLPLLGIGFISCIRLIKEFSFKNIKRFLIRNLWLFVILIGFIESLLFVFSWEYQLERYHYLPLFFGFMFIFIEISFWNKELFRKIKKQVFFSSLLLFFLFIGFFQKRGLNWVGVIKRGVSYQQFHYQTYQEIGRLNNFLYHDLPTGATIFIDHDDQEKVVELGYFSSKLGDRQVNIFSKNKNSVGKGEIFNFSDIIRSDYETEAGQKILIEFDQINGYLSPKVTKNF